VADKELLRFENRLLAGEIGGGHLAAAGEGEEREAERAGAQNGLLAEKCPALPRDSRRGRRVTDPVIG
jgi:hypothetical protein